LTDTILIIDDEADIRNLLADIFEDEHYNVMKAAHSEQALAHIKHHHIDLIILDIWLENSDMDGIEILKHLKQDDRYAHIPVLMISGHGNVEMAVNAMKIGAYDFIEKPFQIDHILLNTKRALTQKQLVEENNQLKTQQGSSDESQDSCFWEVYPSQIMQDLGHRIQEVSALDARSLILGEPGTGKTKVAQTIIKRSKRAGAKTIILNAAEIQDHELSRAVNHVGDGTILIQSIDNLSPANQNSLLHLLSGQNIHCRLIATAVHTLPKLVEAGTFSSSLFDRLSVETVIVPPLRHRREDFYLLCQGIMKDIAQDIGMSESIGYNIPQSAMTLIQDYEWLWNIKHLKTALEWTMYSMMQAGRMTMTLDDLSFLRDDHGDVVGDGLEGGGIALAHQPIMDNDFLSIPLKQSREQFEMRYLTHHLQKFNGNISLMADDIGMERTALHRKLKSLNIHYKPSSYVGGQQL